VKVFKAGYNYGETAEVFQTVYKVPPARFAPGTYRNITGNEALALGLVAGGELAGKSLFFAGYPITPASSILHSLAKYKNFGVMTFQAEDEIAAMGAAIGAAYGGALSVTRVVGPRHRAQGRGHGPGGDDRAAGGDRQRAARRPVDGPADQDRAERPGPGAVRPQRRGADAGDRRALARRLLLRAVEALKVASRYMVPVMLLSDGYIANGSEPWPVPDVTKLDRFDVHHRDRSDRLPRLRARPGDAGARVGHPRHPRLRAPHRRHREGLGHRQHLVRPANHEKMIHTRAAKIERIAQECGELDLRGDTSGDVLLIGWGGTFGSLRQATEELRSQGKKVSHAHLRWLSPLEPGLEKIIRNFKQVVCAELNMGQLRAHLRAKFLLDIQGLNKVQGQPFKVREVVAAIEQLLGGARLSEVNVPTAPTARA
jgi:2-oxoglutarate ferredoxin oxidoreductase subunit alpha